MDDEVDADEFADLEVDVEGYFEHRPYILLKSHEIMRGNLHLAESSYTLHY